MVRINWPFLKFLGLILISLGLSACGKMSLELPSNVALNSTSAIWTITGNDIYYNLGKVGIGTATPGYPLEVVGANSGGDVMKIRGTGAGSTIVFDNSSSVWSGVLGVDNASGNFDIASGAADMIFYTDSTISGWGNERMRISRATGNVGIGTTTPTHRLEVPWKSGDTTSTAFFGGQGTGLNDKVSVEARSEWGAAVLGSSTQDFSILGYDGGATKAAVGGMATVGYGVWGASQSNTSGFFQTSVTNGSNLAPTLVTKANTSQTADLFQAQNSSGTSLVKITGSGNVGIGLTGPTYQLQLSTDSAAKPGTSTWTIASDARLKDIRASFDRSLEALEGIHPIYFRYKQNNPLNLPSEKEYVGIIAQDAQKAVPEAVQTDDLGYLHVTNDAIIWTILNSVKELYHRFMNKSELHDREIVLIKAENEKLKQENTAIKTYLCEKDPGAQFCE